MAARLMVVLLKVGVAVPALAVVAKSASAKYGVHIPGFSDGPL